MGTEEENKTLEEKQRADAEADKAKKDTENSNNESNKDVTLSEEQWAAVFKHPRFKDLNERATKAEKEIEKFNSAKAEAEENKLKEEKKWQELAEKKESDYKSLTEKFNLSIKTKSIIEEAIKLGIKDTDAATKLVDINSIQLDENGVATNAADVVKALAEAKPYLITGEPSKDIGANINPDKTEGQKTVWAMSDLREKMRDHDWTVKHKEEIDLAFKEGRVNYSK
jgi:hypothetical protein